MTSAEVEGYFLMNNDIKAIETKYVTDIDFAVGLKLDGLSFSILLA